VKPRGIPESKKRFYKVCALHHTQNTRTQFMIFTKLVSQTCLLHEMEGMNVWIVYNVPRIQSRSSVTTVIIFGASVRTENQGGTEVTTWPANHSNTACAPSMTRFPSSTTLHVLPCLTIPRAVRRNKRQKETWRIPFATSHSPPARF
jgi:hypothetical protein